METATGRYKYTVVIRSDNKGIHSRIVEQEERTVPYSDFAGSENDTRNRFGYDIKGFREFDISIVIGDFWDIMIDDDNFAPDFKKHPFFLGKDFNYPQLSYDCLYIERPLPLFMLCREIKKNLNPDILNKLSLLKFEEMMNYYRVGFSHNLLYKEKEEIVNSTWETLCSVFDNDFEKFLENNPTFGYSENMYGFDISRLNIESEDSCHLYSCTTMGDIVFSIMHFYISNGYKLTHCKHCGKIFATQNLKSKYCKRNSPYIGYTHLNCERAVGDIKQKLKRRYDVIRIPLYNYSKDNLESLYEVMDNYNSYMADIRKCASISNLKKCEDYLNLDKFKKKWERK